MGQTALLANNHFLTCTRNVTTNYRIAQTKVKTEIYAGGSLICHYERRNMYQFIMSVEELEEKE